MNVQSGPSVEVSDHYVGQDGQRYFAYQKKDVLVGGHLDAEKFSAFVKETDTLLDFGCGSGAVLANLKAARRIGVEPNPAARRFLTENFQGTIEPHASIDEVPDQTVDILISNHCIEHVPGPITALRQMRRVLKPGGRLVVCVPIDDWRVQRHYDSSDINHHLYTWTPLLFGHSLQEAGFSNIDTQIITSCFPPKFVTLYQKFPRWLFNFAGWATAVVKKRRQIRGTAVKT